MTDQIKRFERWCKKLAPDTVLLVSKVRERILPIFFNAGYVRLANYGGLNNPDTSLGRCIVLQRQSGTEWPTVEIRFADLGRSFLIVEFGWLPKICQRWDNGSWVDTPRSDAMLINGYIFFRLMRNRRGRKDSTFGIFLWPIFRPRAALKREVEELRALCLWLIDLLSRDMPPQWGEETVANRVHKNAWRQWGAIALRQRQRSVD